MIAACSRWCLAGLLVLWGQLWWALAPVWRVSEYYGYAWFVPPLAVWFGWRRIEVWRAGGGEARGGTGRGWIALAALALGLFGVLVAIRILWHVDPAWRLPLGVHAAVVVVVTHGLLAMAGGRALSLGMAGVTLFALSAVPYPSVLEQGLVRGLTAGILRVASEIFNLLGRPVVVVGDRLVSGETVVEVTEGCSGIRSFQSFLMAGLFFGELSRLGFVNRVGLVGVAILLAVGVNLGRVLALATVRFDHGGAGFDEVHDTFGLVAFAISATLLYMAAGWLDDRVPGRMRRRKRGRQSG